MAHVLATPNSYSRRITMVKNDLQWSPNDQLLELMASKGIKLQGTPELIGTAKGYIEAVRFKALMPCGRTASIGARLKQYDDTPVFGFTGEVLDEHDDDFEGWTNIDAIGYDYDSVFYSIINQL